MKYRHCPFLVYVILKNKWVVRGATGHQSSLCPSGGQCSFCLILFRHHSFGSPLFTRSMWFGLVPFVLLDWVVVLFIYAFDKLITRGICACFSCRWSPKIDFPLKLVQVWVFSNRYGIICILSKSLATVSRLKWSWNAYCFIDVRWVIGIRFS